MFAPPKHKNNYIERFLIMNLINQFNEDRKSNINKLGSNYLYKKIALDFLEKTADAKYSYNFTWLGLPIIQLPQDIMAMQEIIWQVKPDLIIETGIAHGGSLIFYASMLELLQGDGKVLGIDLDIKPHNRETIERHPMSKRISMIEGSSTDEKVVQQVCDLVKGRKSVLVALDSNHTHVHVLKELELYSPFVMKGSYVVVFDTTIDDMPPDFFPNRPWGKGNNPKTAVHEFLRANERFEIDKDIENKLLITVALDGYLRCVKD
jgi:cephalosporin hydroxylase